MTLKIREICENSWLKCSYTKSFNQFLVKNYQPEGTVVIEQELRPR